MSYFSGLVDYEKRHKVAKCRWCGGDFVRFFAHWVCESAACQERCAEYAVTKLIITDGESPFLYLPLPLQVEVEESKVKRLLVHGAVGVSKSYGGRWSLYSRCRKIRGYQALLLRQTNEQLYKNHLQFMPREAAALGDARFLEGTNKPKQMIFENSSVVFMGYCLHKDDIKIHIGNEWDEIIFEEAVNFAPDALNQISTRDRGSAPSREARYALGIEDGRTRYLTNPGGEAMLYLEDFCIKRAPDPKKYPEYDPQFYGHIEGTIQDNPYLPENFRAATLGGLEFKRLLQLADGRWDVFPGQMFGAFSRRTHVRDCDEAAKDLPVIAAIRWQYNAPGAMIFARVLPTNRVYVEHVWRFENLSVPAAAREIKQQLAALGVTKAKAIYAMPEMGDDTDTDAPVRTEAHTDTFRREGVPMILTDGETFHGWQRVHDFFDVAPDGDPWVLISPRCDSLIRTIPAIRQDDNHPDEIAKGQDDSDVQALRCLFVSRPAPRLPTPDTNPPEAFTLGWFKAQQAKAVAPRGVLARR